MEFHIKIKVKFNKTYRYSTEQLRQHTEQLFTCKLGGRVPTHSGKSPTRSSHFAQMG